MHRGDGAFSGCSGLTSVTIPNSVASIGTGFIDNWAEIESAFDNTAPSFTIYYTNCSTGFTSPTWHGYPAVLLDERTCLAAPWLLQYGLPYDTDLGQDLNGDGVSLLTAYALNPDPNLNLRGSLPKPILGDGTLGISFYGMAEGIIYTVEPSRDLQTWTTEDVIVTEPDEAGQRMATVSRNSKKKFLRPVVAE